MIRYLLMLLYVLSAAEAMRRGEPDHGRVVGAVAQRWDDDVDSQLCPFLHRPLSQAGVRGDAAGNDDPVGLRILSRGKCRADQHVDDGFLEAGRNVGSF